MEEKCKQNYSGFAWTDKTRRYQILCTLFIHLFQPPPPGVMATHTQMAAAHGQPVAMQQPKAGWVEGARGGGYTFWWNVALELRLVHNFLFVDSYKRSGAFWLHLLYICTQIASIKFEWI
jgi:hypothetical protein